MKVFIVVYEPDKEDVYEITAVYSSESEAKNYINRTKHPLDFYIHEADVEGLIEIFSIKDERTNEVIRMFSCYETAKKEMNSLSDPDNYTIDKDFLWD